MTHERLATRLLDAELARLMPCPSCNQLNGRTRTRCVWCAAPLTCPMGEPRPTTAATKGGQP